VSPGHAISEQWLHDVLPSCTRRWDAPSDGGRDQVALHIEKRLEELESAESWEELALRHQAGTPRSTQPYRVAGYEAEASRLGGAIPLDDPRRPAAHLARPGARTRVKVGAGVGRDGPGSCGVDGRRGRLRRRRHDRGGGVRAGPGGRWAASSAAATVATGVAARGRIRVAVVIAGHLFGRGAPR
jgi:hypothetical protein